MNGNTKYEMLSENVASVLVYTMNKFCMNFTFILPSLAITKMSVWYGDIRCYSTFSVCIDMAAFEAVQLVCVL